MLIVKYRLQLVNRTEVCMFQKTQSQKVTVKVVFNITVEQVNRQIVLLHESLQVKILII